MKQEDKELLLKDLSARLLYGVRGKVKADGVDPHKYDIDGFPLEITFDVDVELLRIDTGNDEIFVSTFDDNEDLGNYIEECQSDTPYNIEEFTPYLRPMSSMTESEKKDILQSLNIHGDIDNEGNLLLGVECDIITLKVCKKYLGELNKRMFDVCHMIEKGLALEAPEGMYKID